MFFKKIKSLFKRKKPVLTETKVETTQSSPISFWTAGIKFDSRLENLLECRIKDQVHFIRERENPNDKNAIHVMTERKRSLGYVGRNRAMLLSPMLDEGLIDNVASIVAIQSDLKNELYGVKISLPVSEKIFSKFKKDKLKDVEFVFETSSSGNLYILLNCEENVLAEVKNILKKGGILIGRAGISYAPSSLGKLYAWYIRVDNESDKSLIEKLFRDNFPLLKEKYDTQFNEEYLELQEEELQNLEVQRAVSGERISELEKSLEYYIKRETLYNDQFERMTKIFLPKVCFIRDSTDFLKKEIEDYTTALNKIQELYSNPLSKGKKINTLDKWFDIHFNTGKKDDGRIYFKRKDSRLYVLVSLKAFQKQDIEYLRNE